MQQVPLTPASLLGLVMGFAIGIWLITPSTSETKANDLCPDMSGPMLVHVEKMRVELEAALDRIEAIKQEGKR